VLRLGQYWDYGTKAWTGVEGGTFKGELGVGAAAVDWDGDGDLDLVLGSNSGGLYLRINEGTPTKHAFASESVQLTCDSGPLKNTGGHAIPTIADWDGDGLFDILTGGANGGVVWMRNVGKKGAPAFERAETIVAPRGTPSTNDGPTWPADRTQVHVADYDGDGLLDLLVGDYAAGGGTKLDEMHGWVWLFRRRAPTGR
jgi:hypothetical protein